MSDNVTVSNSRMGMLSRCGQQYRFRYVEGIKAPPGVAMLVGRSVDHSVTKNLEPLLDGGDLLGEEPAQDIAASKMGDEWNASEIHLTPEEKSDGREKVKGAAVDKSVRLAGLHAKRTAPQLKPTHLQRGFEIDLSKQGYPATVIGYLDIQEGDETVRDTKTTAKTPSRDMALRSTQGDLYSTAKMALDGELPREFVLDYLIDLKTPKTLMLKRAIDKSAVERALMRIENFLEVIEAGRFAPADPSSWICSERWCGYWNVCPYAHRPTSISTGDLPW